MRVITHLTTGSAAAATAAAAVLVGYRHPLAGAGARVRLQQRRVMVDAHLGVLLAQLAPAGRHAAGRTDAEHYPQNAAHQAHDCTRTRTQTHRHAASESGNN